MKFTIIPVGQFDSSLSVLSPEDTSNRRETIPVYSYLLETAQGLILFDTGCSHQCRTDPVRLLGADTVPLLTPLLKDTDHIGAQLARLGYEPADIDLVVNSHCHFDHSGGNEIFSTQEFGIQKTEWEAAANNRDSYPDLAYRPPSTNRLTLYEGDVDLLPDVHLLYTPGHTLGHQSLLVELNEGPILITSDAVYTRDHFTLDHIGASANVELATASLRRLIEVANHGARPFFSHDPQQVRIEQWNLAPAFYQ